MQKIEGQERSPEADEEGLKNTKLDERGCQAQKMSLCEEQIFESLSIVKACGQRVRAAKNLNIKKETCLTFMDNEHFSLKGKSIKAYIYQSLYRLQL